MAQTVLNETQIPDVVTDNTIHGTGKTGDPLGVSGTSLPFNFVTGSIAFADSAGFLIEDNKHLRYNSTLRSVRMGKDFPLANSADTFPFFITSESAGTSTISGIYAYGTGTSGAPLSGFGTYRSRGTVEIPTPVQKDDILGSFYGAGYDGANYLNGGRVRFYADGNWVTGTYSPSRTTFLVTPSGTTTQVEKMVLYGDSLNLINTGTYNVNGTPHTHPNTELTTTTLTWTPTWGAVAPMTVSASSTAYARYIQLGKLVFFWVRGTVTTATTASTTITITTPVNPINNGSNAVAVATVVDGTPNVGRGIVSYAGTNLISVVRQVSGVDGNFSLSAGIIIIVSGVYEAA